MLHEEFLSVMQDKFMRGEEEEFDYNAVDTNSEYDDVTIRQRDEEEQYFDEEDNWLQYWQVNMINFRLFAKRNIYRILLLNVDSLVCINKCYYIIIYYIKWKTVRKYPIRIQNGFCTTDKLARTWLEVVRVTSLCHSRSLSLFSVGACQCTQLPFWFFV